MDLGPESMLMSSVSISYGLSKGRMMNASGLLVDWFQMLREPFTKVFQDISTTSYLL